MFLIHCHLKKVSSYDVVLRPGRVRLHVAVGETVILLHPALSLVGVSIETMRECQQNDSLADG